MLAPGGSVWSYGYGFFISISLSYKTTTGADFIAILRCFSVAKIATLLGLTLETLDDPMTKLQELLQKKSRQDLRIFAKEVGVDLVTVYRWRSGTSLPRQQYASKVIRFFKNCALDHNGIYGVEGDSDEP
jgi:hypothetical protein